MANSPYHLFALAGAGPSLTAQATASALVGSSPAAGQIRPKVPSLWLEYGGRMTVEAAGVLTTASTPGTGTWDIRLGSVTVATSGAVPLTASMVTWKWYLYMDLLMRVEGAGTVSQFWPQGWIAFGASATSDTVKQLAYNTNPPVLGTGFDCTVDQVFDINWTPSLSTATFVCHLATAVLWNPVF